MSVDTRKLGPIGQAFLDGFASSSARWHGDDLPLEINLAFDKAAQYAKEHGEDGEEPKAE